MKQLWRERKVTGGERGKGGGEGRSIKKDSGKRREQGGEGGGGGGGTKEGFITRST